MNIALSNINIFFFVFLLRREIYHLLCVVQVRYNENQETDQPWIAGCFTKQHIPFAMTLGDRETYEGYYNGELDSNSYYGVFIAGLAKTSDNVRNIKCIDLLTSLVDGSDK